MTYQAAKAQLVNHPATHSWVIRAIRELENRDPVDVVGDLETLLELFRLRCVELEERLEELGIEELRAKYGPTAGL